MDGIKIIKDDANIPICSGYKCDKIIDLKHQNDPLHSSCVPFGLVVFPNLPFNSGTDESDQYLQVDVKENDSIDIQNKILDKLLKSQCSFKASNKTCNNRSKLKLEKTRKIKR